MATSEILPLFQRRKSPQPPHHAGNSGRPRTPGQSGNPNRSVSPSGPGKLAPRSVTARAVPSSDASALRARVAQGRGMGGRNAASTHGPQSTQGTHGTQVSLRTAGPTKAAMGDRPARRFLIRAGIAVVVVAVGVFALAFLGVLPARTYFGQQDELVQKKARLIMLGERNAVLGNRVAALQSDQVVARIARDQFGMVAPGDTLTVLPGLRDASLSLNGDGSNVVTAVPPADVVADPALLSSLLNWIRGIVS
jgi:cell division protein FtsB